MIRRLPHRLLAYTLCLALPLVGLGCESGVDTADGTAEMTAETKRASALLPADAPMTAMLDLQSLRTRGPERLRKALGLERMDDASESAARFRNFLEDSGIDLDRDLTRMYVAAAPNGDAAPHVVVYGSFDRARIEETLQSTYGNRLTRSVHKQTTVFTATPDAKTGASSERSALSLAVVNDDVILGAASPEQVAQMLDRDGRGSEAAPDDLMRRAAQGTSAWMVVRGVNGPTGDAPTGAPADAAAETSDGGPPAEIRKLGRVVRDVAASLSFASDGRLDGRVWLVPADGAAAEDVADVVRGGLAAMKQKASERPTWASALDRVTVRTDGDRVDVSFDLPPSLVNDLAAEDGS